MVFDYQFIYIFDSVVCSCFISELNILTETPIDMIRSSHREITTTTTSGIFMFNYGQVFSLFSGKTNKKTNKKK